MSLRAACIVAVCTDCCPACIVAEAVSFACSWTLIVVFARWKQLALWVDPLCCCLAADAVYKAGTAADTVVADKSTEQFGEIRGFRGRLPNRHRRSRGTPGDKLR